MASVPESAPPAIADELLAWFDRHGRHDLPWQHPRTAYRVWVAEIMLQQTQVTTVIGYFKAFMARFPDVATLAAAESDTVMAYWAGLGYYARARNLHAAARRLIVDFNGCFPRDVETLMSLPGIGRSTAGAILSQAFSIPAPVLDGNAKRVLARLAGIDATPATAAYEKPLWALAERYTPSQRVTDYTQAIMDLGATLCMRSRPACDQCPLAAKCLAKAQGRQAEIPAKRNHRRAPHRHTLMLLIEDDDGHLLLEKRPAIGVWGGLWSLPEAAPDADLPEICRTRFGVEVVAGDTLEPIAHSFTHFSLTIHPRRMQYVATTRIMETDFAWFAACELPGLPAPVARLLDSPQRKQSL